MWGDYHARELALYLGRLIGGGPYHAFFLAQKVVNIIQTPSQHEY